MIIMNNSLKTNDFDLWKIIEQEKKKAGRTYRINCI